MQLWNGTQHWHSWRLCCCWIRGSTAWRSGRTCACLCGRCMTTSSAKRLEWWVRCQRDRSPHQYGKNAWHGAISVPCGCSNRGSCTCKWCLTAVDGLQMHRLLEVERSKPIVQLVKLMTIVVRQHCNDAAHILGHLCAVMLWESKQTLQLTHASLHSFAPSRLPLARWCSISTSSSKLHY